MHKLILICLLSFLQLHLSAQTAPGSSSCTNSDFESGDLSGWVGKTGNCCPINASLVGMVSGRHTIMTGTGTDPYTCDMVTVVAPGGQYSARLGNSDSGSQAESLSYSLNVTASSALFIYRYAVVLEDPGHAAADQPRFQVRVLDATNHVLDPVCGVYTVAAASGLAGFADCTNLATVRYRDWTTVGLNLTSYIGQNVTLEFSTGDCALGAHFGYAYVDAYCSPLAITANYCSGSFSAELIAPVGFQYLWSNGATTRTIEVNNPTAGQTYSCLLTSVTGCTVSISTSLQQVDPSAEFTVTNACYNDAVFQNTSFTPAGISLSTYSWDFGDGTTFSGENAQHTYAAAGTYTVTYTISNARGCISTITHPVTVVNPPTAAIRYGNTAYCTSQTTNQPISLTGTGPFTGGVYSCPNAALSLNSTTGAIIPSLSTPGTYTVTYKIPTTNNCTVPDVSTTVTITPVPTASITYFDGTYCSTEPVQNVQLTGTGTYLGGNYTAANGLQLNSTNGQVSPPSSTPGNYVITYTIPAFGGCPSIPVTTSVQINPLPKPAIEDGRICVDENGNTFRTVLLDTGLSETQFSFAWTFENAPIAGATQSSYMADALGSYSVIVTNNSTGCVSFPAVAVIEQSDTPTTFLMTISNSFTENAALTVTVVGGTGPFLFQMDDGPVQANSTFFNPPAGLHHIHLTDIYGCTDLSQDIVIMEYPKFFTPNDDGHFDTWILHHLDQQPNATIRIFDRYGKFIKQLSPGGEGWDGTYNGKPLPASDYWFTVDYQVTNTTGAAVWEQFKSHFSLKR